MTIGVAITTHNRNDIAGITVNRWRALLPKGAVLIVVDDASTVPYPRADYRFEENVGIARAKNKCFEILEDLGVTDFFLADNDCYPTNKNWWKPYVESPEAHLSYQFLDLKSSKKLRDIKELYRDNKHVAYSGQRGCMLYFKKSALEAVGGFDPIYGRALYEHSDLANRIHEAGLTTWRYADVVDSHKLWHSMDEYLEVNRTVPQSEQQKLLRGNANIHNTRREQGYQAFVPYRDEITDKKSDVLITTLLTRNPDPQRGVKWNPDASMISPWLESVERGEWTGIVLADELKKLPRGYAASQVVNVPTSKMNVYYQRWLHIYQYLRDNPHLRWVWCTDGSDVEVLRDPFKGMAPGKLYVGVEESIVDIDWMRQNHQAEKFRILFREHGSSPLLNAGVIGGDRLTVQTFAQKMVTLYNDIESQRFWGQDPSPPEIGDMAAFNYNAYFNFGSRLVYGPEITTVFKEFKDNGIAKFQHK